ncbi:MAG TPA: DUF488 family protein [Acidimicrobiales bacterium]|jgi:uncharacterized protein YeaO (DUF488 family)|nr:DUF488 family protein [Acidimicrobiales bacterium]
MPSRRGSGFEIRRIYDQHDDDGSYRVLVDRLWPRGVTKADAALDEWAKDVAPSTESRRWYGHDPTKFEQFARRYLDELKAPGAADAVARLRAIARQRPVALLTATRDVGHSGASVLKDVLGTS